MNTPNISKIWEIKIFSLEEKRENYNTILEECNKLMLENKMSVVVNIAKECKELWILTIDDLWLLYCHIWKTLSERNNENEVISLLWDMKKENFNPIVYTMLSGLLWHIYTKKEMYQIAIETLKHALENPTEDLVWNLHYDLWYCYHMTKNYQKAKEHYELSLQSNPPKQNIIGIENQIFRLSIVSKINWFLNFFR